MTVTAASVRPRDHDAQENARIRAGRSRSTAARPGLLGAMPLLLTIGLVSCGTEAKHALDLKLSPGRTFVLSMHLDRVNEIAIGYGERQRHEGTDEWQLRFTVMDRDAHGNARLSVHVEDARFDGLRRPVSKVLKGKTFEIVVSPTGETVEFRDTDALREEARAELKPPRYALLTPEMRQELLEVYLRAFSDDSLTALIEPLFYVWPSLPLGVGDRWTRESTYWPEFDVNVNSEFELISWQSGRAEIAVVRRYEHAGRHPLVDFTGSGAGTMTIATVEGMLRRYHETRTLNGEKLSENAGEPIVHAESRQDLYVEVFEE